MIQRTYLPGVECISKSRNLQMESELQEKVYFDLHTSLYFEVIEYVIIFSNVSDQHYYKTAQ